MIDTTSLCLSLFLAAALIGYFVCSKQANEAFKLDASQKQQMLYNPLALTPKNLYGPNKYFESCGPCLPADNDPYTYEQKCVVYNSQQYPLLYYTMTKDCANCRFIGNNTLSCDSTWQPGNVYLGTNTASVGANFCGSDSCSSFTPALHARKN